MNEDRGESARRNRRRAGRGLVSVLIGTALLAVLGFGFGIVAGLVMEEPGLLLDYVTGKTKPAPLEATRSANEFAAAEREKADALPPPTASAAAETPGAAESAHANEAPAEAKPEPAAKEPVAAKTSPAAKTPTSQPPQVAAGPPSPPAGKSAWPARTEPKPAAGADAEPLVPAAPGTGGYSVQVGALADAASAEQLAVKLRKRGFPVYVAPSAEPSSKRWRVRVGPVKTREQADALAAKLEKEKLPTWVLAEGLH